MPPTEPKALCVSIHDVAPDTWADCVRLQRAVRAVADIPLTWLVVPRYHGRAPAAPAMERALDALLAQGHELALHGYTHLDSAPPARGLRSRFLRTVFTQGEGEFAAIDEADARQRIALGLAWFAERGWPVRGFVPPAWLLGEARLARAARVPVRLHHDDDPLSFAAGRAPRCGAVAGLHGAQCRRGAAVAARGRRAGGTDGAGAAGAAEPASGATPISGAAAPRAAPGRAPAGRPAPAHEGAFAGATPRALTSTDPTARRRPSASGHSRHTRGRIAIARDVVLGAELQHAIAPRVSVGLRSRSGRKPGRTRR